MNSYADKKLDEGFVRIIMPTGQIIEEVNPDLN